MDTDTLKIFLHLAGTLHYGKTSKACNVSPSTLSRIIKRLEDSVGELLFERDNRSVKLTETGKSFKKYAKETVLKWESFQNSLANENTVLTGEISIYCTITASYGVLPNILVQFRESCPDVHMKLLTGDSDSAIQKVLSEDADFAVAALPDKTPEKLLFKKITDMHLKFVAPTIPWQYEVLIEKNSIPWDEIPIIVTGRGMARKRIDSWFKKRKTKPNIYAQVAGNESILAMVSMGFGIGIVPELILRKNFINRNVQVLDIKPELMPYSVGICVQKKRMANPVVKAFWENI
jgi:LysR family positive regulator for ilvC